MKQLKQLLFTISLLLLTQASFGQAAFCFTPDQVSVDNDTVWYVAQNDTDVHYTMHVLNCGNATYTGTVNIMMKRNNNPAFIFGTLTNVNLAAGDSVEFQATDGVVNNEYKGGDNVIVIWPAAPNPPPNTNDTATVNIYIDGPVSAISNPQLGFGDRFSFGPNPLGSKIEFQYHGSPAELQSLQITDLTGKVLVEEQREIKSIDCAEWMPGVYFIELRYEDGKSGAFKLLKAQ